MSPLGVYIHIPFCRSICSYCDFCKVLYQKEWAVNYLKRLKEEIENRYMGEEVRTIYIGGGTPSALSLKEIECLLLLTNKFSKKHLEEFTFECNIEDVTEELLLLLRKFQVNRLSIGIESFDQQNLKYMKRNTDFSVCAQKIALARRLGFQNINLDLIYALPEESFHTLKKDVKLLLKLNPEHISTYSLIIEDHTLLKYQQVKNISSDLDAKMYDYINYKLSKKGYHRYEVSNFSKVNHESRHNLIYWNNEEYYGFGCGASGYIAGVRYDNTRSLSKYLDGHWNGTEEILGKETMMENEIILGLRKTSGINLEAFYQKYGVNIGDVFPIKKLLREKDLIYDKGSVMINPEKIYVMNEILLKLV